MRSHGLVWFGHVVQMDDSRLPKAIFYGQLTSGTWPGTGSWKDTKMDWSLVSSIVLSIPYLGNQLPWTVPYSDTRASLLSNLNPTDWQISKTKDDVAKIVFKIYSEARPLTSMWKTTTFPRVGLNTTGKCAESWQCRLSLTRLLHRGFVRNISRGFSRTFHDLLSCVFHDLPVPCTAHRSTLF